MSDREASKRRRSRKKRTLPMSLEERGRTLRELFEEIKMAHEPCYPALFCERAGVSKGTLRKYQDLALDVWDYGFATWPGKMRGRRPVPRPAVGGNGKVEREHRRWSKEVPQLRKKVREQDQCIGELKAENAQVKRDLEVRSRLLEVLIHRVAERSTADAKDIQILLAETLAATNAVGDRRHAEHPQQAPALPHDARGATRAADQPTSEMRAELHAR